MSQANFKALTGVINKLLSIALLKTLGSRLIVAAALSLLGSLVSGFYMAKDEIESIEINAQSKRVTGRMLQVLELLNSMPAIERPIVLRRLRNEHVYFLSGLTPVFFPTIKPVEVGTHYAPMVEAVADGLKPFPVVEAGLSDNDDFETWQQWRGMMPPQLTPEKKEGLEDERHIDQKTLISVVVQLEDRSFVWIGMDSQLLKGHPFRRLTRAFVLIGLPLVIVIGLSLHWILRPLRQLATAAQSIGESLQKTPDMPQSGPQEIMMVSVALQKMHHNLRQQFERLLIALGALSHDLRTPLQRLRLRVELIENDATRDKLHRDIDELHQRVEDGLSYLRSEGQGYDDGTLEKIDIRDLMHEVVDTYQKSQQAVININAIEHQQPTAALWVRGRRTALLRVIGNLVDNALYYGHCAELSLIQSPAPTVMEGEKKIGALLTIRDKGEGIKEEHLQKVFEPFVRLEQSRHLECHTTSNLDGLDDKPQSDTTTPPQSPRPQSPTPKVGSGLGLTIARGIALQHHGHLSLSNHPEGGLVASLWLPLA